MSHLPASKNICDHDFQEDPDFADGTVIMEFNGEQESRFYCKKCGKVTYEKR